MLVRPTISRLLATSCLRARMATGAEWARMPSLPHEDVVKYRALGPFWREWPLRSGGFIPKGLLKDHSTKAGTWGVIDVSAGRLEYEIAGLASDPPALFELVAPARGIIEPEALHRVTPLSNDLVFGVDL